MLDVELVLSVFLCVCYKHNIFVDHLPVLDIDVYVKYFT